MTEINPKIFKTYDIRGIYPSEINKKTAFLIGRALADFLHAKKIVVGRGVRYSSKKLQKHLTKGLLRQGVDVIDLGLISTPVLYSRTFKEGIDGGVIVTASHNPAEYNGFKILISNGEMLGLETGLKEVLRIIQKQYCQEVEKRGLLSKERDAVKNYVFEIIKSFPFFKKLKNFRIAVDAAHGAGGGVIKELFKYLDSQLFKLEFRPDPRFRNIGGLAFFGFIPYSPLESIPNPLFLETLQDLALKIRKKKCDVGFALDGDADRIVILDEKGSFIPPDLITALIAKEVLKEKKGAKIAYEVRSSRAVAEAIKEAGGAPVKMPAGSAIMKKRMKENKMIFGGEASGHYFFRETFYAESPILIILLVLKILTQKGKPLSEIIKPLRRYYKAPEINFETENKEKIFTVLKRKYNDAQISFIDGITIEYPDWWFNLRASRTEPLLRLNLEANKKEVFNKKLKEVKELIKNV